MTRSGGSSLGLRGPCPRRRSGTMAMGYLGGLLIQGCGLVDRWYERVSRRMPTGSASSASRWARSRKKKSATTASASPSGRPTTGRKAGLSARPPRRRRARSVTRTPRKSQGQQLLGVASTASMCAASTSQHGETSPRANPRAAGSPSPDYSRSRPMKSVSGNLLTGRQYRCP